MRIFAAQLFLLLLASCLKIGYENTVSSTDKKLMQEYDLNPYGFNTANLAGKQKYIINHISYKEFSVSRARALLLSYLNDFEHLMNSPCKSKVNKTFCKDDLQVAFTFCDPDEDENSSPCALSNIVYNEGMITYSHYSKTNNQFEIIAEETYEEACKALQDLNFNQTDLTPNF